VDLDDFDYVMVRERWSERGRQRTCARAKVGQGRGGGPREDGVYQERERLNALFSDKGGGVLIVARREGCA
jgi:hypothetical protein